MIPPFVDLDWLKAALHGDRRLVIADARWYIDGRSGRDAYESGHIPGAVFIDLECSLAGSSNQGHGRHPFADPEVFAEGMSQAGIDDDSVVVAYDDQGGVIAARLVWMLRASGHDAALLDGGLNSYEGDLETGFNSPDRGVFTPRAWPSERLATADDAADTENIVIDARPPSRYLGEEEPFDPRPGHIPGAWNISCRANLGSDGTLLPVDELLRNFEVAGIVPGQSGVPADGVPADGVPADGVPADRVVSYCGSGITACHNLLVLEHCGFGEGFGRLYPGSWSEYSTLTDRPTATLERN
jgi:thiosulfate/3-mercaptopyruvate sulfurtransferase